MEKPHTLLERFTHGFVKWAATSLGFASAFCISLALLVSGLFLPAQRWGNLLTAVSGIGSFLMIFMMQRSQSKDFQALQIKLNELLASHEGADNKLINIESASELHLRSIHDHHEQIK